jgi:signal transduction histidine kinase
MTRRVPSRYYLASLLLLLAVVTLYAASVARRTQQEQARQLEEKGLALAEALEASSRSAIRGNALMEEMIAQRLLDNARLVDRLLEARPLGPPALAEIARANGLRRIDILDRDGRPVPPPYGASHRGPGPGGAHAMPRMMEGAGRRPPGSMPGPMLHLWGRRWSGGPGPAAPREAPPAVVSRKFWEGTLFGVAVEATTFDGIIAVHADAASVLDFQKAIGVERHVMDLARQSGVDEVAILGPDLTILAHSEASRVGERLADPALAGALRDGRGLTRVLERAGDADVFQVARPLALDAERRGLLTIGLSTAPMRAAWRRDVESAVVLGFAVVVAGAIGLAVVFVLQHRHLEEVQTLGAEVERRERLSALGNLAATVAHEIRNPLNAISMGLQRMRAEFVPAEGEAEYGRVADIVQGEVRRLNGIVEAFLTLARPLALRPAIAPVAPLVGEVADLIAPEAESRRVRVATAVAPGLPPACLDADHVKQVLLNLTRNALEAMPKGGVLTLAAAAHDGTLVLTVEDTGSGIPSDVLPRIFEPYVTTKARGTGLGLAIARRIVEAHGGRIEATTREGRGARFTVALPLDGRGARG